MREKLIELLGKCPCGNAGEMKALGSCVDRKYGLCDEVARLSYCTLRYLADHLIANGVCIVPDAFVIKHDIPESDIQRLREAMLLPGEIMPYTPGEESVEIVHELIPVSDPPKKEGRYLVYESDTGNYFDSYYDETEGEFGEWQNCFDPFTLGVIDCEWNNCPNVTHWMHLPQPPKGE